MIAAFTLCSKRAFTDVIECVFLKIFSDGKPPGPHPSSDPHSFSAPLPQQSFSIAKVKLTCLQFNEVTRPVVSATFLHPESTLWHELWKR